MHRMPRLGTIGFVGRSCRPPPRLPCPSPHISSCWMLDLAVRQPGTGCCFQGDEEELGGESVLPMGSCCCRAHPATWDPPCDPPIRVLRGTNTISALPLEGGSGFAYCIGGRKRAFLQAQV